MSADMHEQAQVVSRPLWDDAFLYDPAALQRYTDDQRTFQPTSPDPLDRVECFLWPQTTPAQACAILNAAFQTAALFETNGQLEAARLANNEARLAAGRPPLSEGEYRSRFVREFIVMEIFKLLPALESLDSGGHAKRSEIFDGAAMITTALTTAIIKLDRRSSARPSHDVGDIHGS